MATVLKSGEEKKAERESIKYKITCTECDSDIKYCESEVFEKRISPFIFNVPDFLKLTYRFLKCPECGHDICETDYNRQRIS